MKRSEFKEANKGEETKDEMKEHKEDEGSERRFEETNESEETIGSEESRAAAVRHAEILGLFKDLSSSSIRRILEPHS